MAVQTFLCDSEFRDSIAGFDDALHNANVVSIVGLWSDFRIACLSPGWFQFAQDNSGEPAISQRWQLGSELLSGISPGLREFFADGYRRSLTEGSPWVHCYQCSSPEVFRWLHCITYPLPDRQGLLVVHSRLIENLRSELDPGQGVSSQSYQDEHGLIHQCSYCRRVQRADSHNEWDFVLKWAVKSPPATSHGMCPGCYSHYASRIIKGQDCALPRFTTEADAGGAMAV